MNLKMTKDYTLLLGKKFGDREVLDITRKYNGKWNAAFAICKCKCGSIDEIPMNQLKAGRRSRCPKCAEKKMKTSQLVLDISRTIKLMMILSLQLKETVNGSPSTREHQMKRF